MPYIKTFLGPGYLGNHYKLKIQKNYVGIDFWLVFIKEQKRTYFVWLLKQRLSITVLKNKSSHFSLPGFEEGNFMKPVN